MRVPGNLWVRRGKVFPFVTLTLCLLLSAHLFSMKLAEAPPWEHTGAAFLSGKLRSLVQEGPGAPSSGQQLLLWAVGPKWASCGPPVAQEPPRVVSKLCMYLDLTVGRTVHGFHEIP